MKKATILVLAFTLIGCGKKWYEGGNLHDASALEWQAATKENKLATCADFAIRMYGAKVLKDEISSKISDIDSMRPLAESFVEFLDAAFKKDADPEKNKQLYANMKVSDTLALGVMMMGYGKQ